MSSSKLTFAALLAAAALSGPVLAQEACGLGTATECPPAEPVEAEAPATETVPGLGGDAVVVVQSEPEAPPAQEGPALGGGAAPEPLAN